MKPPIWWRNISRYERTLVVLFAVSLPLVNPWVRGDGVGYYAYARALVVNHNLQFEADWQHANPSFRSGRVDTDGRIHADQFTATGHLDNHFAIGASLLWIPFIAVTHLAVLGVNELGAKIPADGFSWPYLDTMAVVTACAGFAGLLISFRLTRKYLPERWAFLGTLGIWLASSLPVYMYFNPSWSHAQSAFAVALFLWYWDCTRGACTVHQWFLLGLLGGLMMNMYYPNAIFILLIVIELAFALTKEAYRGIPILARAGVFVRSYALFSTALVLAFLPTLLTRQIIYGSIFALGYSETKAWTFSNAFWGKVLFSADHGLFSWTPVLLLASIGLLFLWRKNRVFAAGVTISTIAFYFLIATYPVWDGISSYGNRFFISLTPIFVLGLAALLSANEDFLRRRKTALVGASAALLLLIVWNLGFIFQWGMQLVPDRGPISWSQMVSNQFRVVPVDVSESLIHYLVGRHTLMEQIEKKDLRQLYDNDPPAKARGGR